MTMPASTLLLHLLILTRFVSEQLGGETLSAMAFGQARVTNDARDFWRASTKLE
jgi:hypothetical protein